MKTIYNIKLTFLCCPDIIEFTKLEETYNNHFRVEIWYKTEESKTASDLSDLGD